MNPAIYASSMREFKRAFGKILFGWWRRSSRRLSSRPVINFSGSEINVRRQSFRPDCELRNSHAGGMTARHSRISLDATVGVTSPSSLTIHPHVSMGEARSARSTIRDKCGKTASNPPSLATRRRTAASQSPVTSVHRNRRYTKSKSASLWSSVSQPSSIVLDQAKHPSILLTTVYDESHHGPFSRPASLTPTTFGSFSSMTSSFRPEVYDFSWMDAEDIEEEENEGEKVTYRSSIKRGEHASLGASHSPQRSPDIDFKRVTSEVATTGTNRAPRFEDRYALYSSLPTSPVSQRPDFPEVRPRIHLLQFQLSQETVI